MFVADGAATDVRSTGFGNVALYREVRDLPESLIADVVARYAKWVDAFRAASDELLAKGTVNASYEPRFGMDAIDSDTIFGETGELSRLIAFAERKKR